MCRELALQQCHKTVTVDEAQDEDIDLGQDISLAV